MAAIIDIEGIGPQYAEKLKAAGIATVESLLAQGSTPAGRKTIEEKTGIGHKLVLKWVNHADLFRINGVAGQFAELLEASGVDTVAELSHRNAENLHAAMVKVNEEKKLVHVIPEVAHITRWIAEAKTLPKGVTY
jgi:predicted flap endonuclease-1-like 5' DNA nuclease